MTTVPIRIGNPPRLPLAVRRAHLLRQLGRYVLAWGLVGVACYWTALGSTGLGLALIAIAGFTCGPRPARTPKTRGARVHDSSLGEGSAINSRVPQRGGGLPADVSP